MGVLFYLVGVLKTDIVSHQFFADVAECEFGQKNVLPVACVGTAPMGDYNERGNAVFNGLSFDFLVGANTMLRAEVKYIKGQDKLTVMIEKQGCDIIFQHYIKIDFRLT